MDNLGTTVYAGGVGPSLNASGIMVVDPANVRVEAPKVGKDYVAGGYRQHLDWAAVPAQVPPIAQLERQWGTRLWDWMMTDATVKGSIGTIKDAILSDGIQLSPACNPPIQDEKVPTPGQTTGPPPDAAEDKADAERSAEITEFCRWAIDRLNPTLNTTLHQMLDCVAYKNALAEIVYEMVEDGEYKGMTCFAGIKSKPRWSWGIAVDRYMNILGMVSRDQVEEEQVILPRMKFAFLKWAPTTNEPFGTSALTCAYQPWAFKIQLWTQYFDYLSQFASPIIVGTTPEGAKDRQPRDSSGNILQGVAPITAVQDLMNVLVTVGQSKALALPFGTEVNALEVKSDGTPFLSAFATMDKFIVFGLMQQIRATMEAQHGSKADSQTAQDIFGLVIRVAKQWVSDMIRDDILKPLVTLNYGAEDAELHTPIVKMGDTEHQDFAAYVNALANFLAAGGIHPQQLPALLDWLGLPLPHVEGMTDFFMAKAIGAQPDSSSVGKGNQTDNKAKQGNAA